MLLLESIHAFLAAKAAKQENSLLDRVVDTSKSLELQINAAQDNGELVAGARNTYSDGLTTWGSIRIPRNAGCDPKFDDGTPISWVLDEHAEAIGSTGWNWRERVSLWVGFDIDSKAGHSGGLDEAALQAVIEAASRVPYIEIRRSSSGKGIHLYAFFNSIDSVQNHTIHAALAKVVLVKMGQDAGFDFSPYVDVCGGNMWVWRRNQTPESFSLIKPHAGLISEWSGKSDPLYSLPEDWRNQIPAPKNVPEKCTAGCITILSDAQKDFINTLVSKPYSAIWHADKHCLHAHTRAIQETHAELKLRGVFKTISAGEHPSECNCFCYPLDDDAWRVVRFSQGVKEDDTWIQDGSGWTSCVINEGINLSSAAELFNGVEIPKSGGYVFENSAEAEQAALAIGHTLVIPAEFADRRIKLDTQKDGRLVVSLERHPEDDTPANWCAEKRAWFQRILGTKPEKQQSDIGERFRYVYEDTDQRGKASLWFRHFYQWDLVDSIHAAHVIKKHLHDANATSDILGHAIEHPWYFDDIPFGPEEDGNKWRLRSAQLRVQPTTRSPVHPTWDKVLNHTFAQLDDAVGQDPWCKKYGIKTGRDYAILWIASMIRKPFDRKPYLFLAGEEDCGKTTFHESLRYLITNNGIMDISNIISGRDMFTGAIRHTVLAYIEEKSFKNMPAAAELMRKLTGDKYVDLRAMRREQIQIKNKLHFIHVANTMEAAPFGPTKDTRITLVWVDRIKDYIPQAILRGLLQAEAPHFLRTLLEVALPPTDRSRFCLPIIETDHKRGLQDAHKSLINRFIDDNCKRGAGIPIDEFCLRYSNWARERTDFDGNDSKQYIMSILPIGCPTTTNMVSNLTWK